MIAAALLVVLGSATLMQLAGLSMAMGAFVAGVMLAESSYRHELEADIEPFRGILLGLFFMAVGLSLELDVVIENWATILIAVPILMVVKARRHLCGLPAVRLPPRERGAHRAAAAAGRRVRLRAVFGRGFRRDLFDRDRVAADRDRDAVDGDDAAVRSGDAVLHRAGGRRAARGGFRRRQAPTC